MRGTRHAGASAIALAAFVTWPCIALPQATPHVAIVTVDPAGYVPHAWSARAAAAKAFYATHRDAYDFLVLFPTFPVDLSRQGPGEVLGRHWGVRNDVSGIGMLPTDAGADFGSSARLKGAIDIHSLVPGVIDGSFDATLGTLAHEVAHQWSGAVGFRDPVTGTRSTALLGQDGAHWSYALSSDASVLYGSKWRDRGDGTFVAEESRRRYSSLDLYLMGFLAPGEVPPFTLITPAAGAALPVDGLPPPDGTTLAGVGRSISASDVIAAEGARVPGADRAQAVFRAAFVVLVAPGQVPSPQQLRFVDAVRREWANKFFFMTRGRGVMETDLVEAPPGPVASSPSTTAALNWLIASQQPDGRWADSPGEEVRDTGAAVEALARFQANQAASAASGRGAEYLSAREHHHADGCARAWLAVLAMGTGAPFGMAECFDPAWLVAEGGIAPASGYTSTPVDSLLSGLALQAKGSSPAAVASVVEYLLVHQNRDGGWGYLPEGPSQVEPTAWALELLARVQSGAAAVEAGITFLVLHRDPLGGGFGDLASDPSDTAEAVLALAAWSALTPEMASAAAEHLLSTQRPDGSWDGSVYETALAVRALAGVLSRNLAVGSVSIAATSATDGELSLVSAQVVNTGALVVEGATVRAFDSNGKPFGPVVAVPTLWPGQRVTVALVLDTSGHSGSTQVFVVVDPEGRIEESNKADNRVALPFAVAAPPSLPDLVVLAGSISSNPPIIESLPTQVAISALVGNVGLTDVGAAVVEVRVRGVPAGSIVVDLPARSRVPVAIPVSVGAGAGDVPIEVVVDPGGNVPEAREDNNVADSIIPAVPGVDLRIADLTLSLATLDQGQVLQIAYTLSNAGTSDAHVGVEIRMVDESGRTAAVMLDPAVTVGAGAVLARNAAWTASAVGAITIIVDASYAADRMPSDNVAVAHATVRPSPEPNLVIRPADLVASPDPALEGMPVNVSATVRNVGGGPAGTFALELWLGSPSSGRRIARFAAPGLDAGGSWTESVSIPVTAPADLTVTAIVDPDASVPESDESDNVTVLGIPVRALPDLTLGSGALTLSTAFPRLGESVDVAVTVSNGGGQPSGTTDLELRYASASGTETAVASRQLLPVEPGGSANVSFQWTASIPGSGILVAAVNGSRAARESNYDNDRSERSILVQDGPVALTNPFFSPNGDGIKDVTEIFWRSGANVPVSVEIASARDGAVVRRLGGTGGSIAWDGRDEDGRVVRDGAYVVGVMADVALLGHATAVVDTNRSPLHEAPPSMIETEEAAALVQDRYGSDVRPLADDSGIVLNGWGPSGPAGTLQYGLHLQRFDGTAPVFLIAGDRDGAFASRFAVSPDGSSVAYLRNDCSAATPRAPDCVSLHLVSVPGGEDRRVWEAPGYASWVTGFYAPVFSPDGRRVAFIAGYGASGFTIEAVGVDGSDHRVIAGSGSYGESVWSWSPEEIAYSPDGVWLSFVEQDLDLAMSRDGSPGHAILYRPPPWRGWSSEPDGGDRHVWSPKAHEIAAAYEQGILAVDVATQAVRTLVSPSMLDSIDPDFIQDGKLAMDPWGEALAFPAGPAGKPRYDGRHRIMLSAPPGAMPTTFWEAPLAGTGIGGFGWSSSGALMHVTQCCSAGEPLPGVWSRGNYQHFLVRSLANLATRISAIRNPGASYVEFRGTASDLNFERYEIRTRLLQDGAPSRTVVTSSSPVIGAVLGTWTPPAPGVYEATLVAFDKAGNARERRARFTWGNVSPFANVRRDPEFISPNADGVQDQAILSYSVMGPATVVATVSDDAGAVVRKVQRAYVGPQESSIAWDGRDDSGVLVPDGVYWLGIQGMRFRVVVDTKRPVVNFALLDDVRPRGKFDFSPRKVTGTTGHSPCAVVNWEGAYEVPQVLANASWQVTDENLAEWRLESVTAGSPEVFFFGTSQSLERREMAPSEVSGRTVRIAAHDRAGNVAYSQEESFREALFLLGYGIESMTDFCTALGLLNVRPTYQVYPGPFAGLATFDQSGNGSAPFSVPQGERGLFVFSDTIRDPIVSLAVAYRTSDDQPLFYDYSVENFLNVGALWDVGRAIVGQPANLQFRIEAVDLNGRVFVSELATVSLGREGASSVCLEGERLERLRFALPDGRDVHQLRHDTGTLEFRLPGASIPERSYRVQDLSWVGPDLVADASSLAACVYDVTFSGSWDDNWPLQRTDRIDLCGAYVRSAEVSGTTAYVALGETFRGPLVGVTTYLPDPANGGKWLLAGDVGAFEGASPVFSLDLTGQAMCKPTGVKLVTRLVDGTVVDETAHPAFKLCPARVQPLEVPCTRVDVGRWARTDAEACSGRASEVKVPIGGTSTRTIAALDATLVTQAGTPIGQLPTVGFAPGSHVSAMATIPVETLADGTYLVRADVLDDAGYAAHDVSAIEEALQVEHAPPVVSLASPRAGDTVCPIPATAPDGTPTWVVDVQGSVSDPHLEYVSVQYKRASAGAYGPGLRTTTSLPTLSGTLGRVPVDPGLGGDYAVRVSARDSIGNETCGAETIFHVPGDLRLASATAQPRVFSPDGDGTLDTAVLSFALEEAADVHVAALLPGGRRSTIAQFRAGAGTKSVVWNGKFTDGIAAPDGPVAIEIDATGPCGQSARASLDLEVDTSPPVVQVSAPTPGARVSAALLVAGSVHDAHLREWEVSLAAAGGSPFEVIATGTDAAWGTLATIPVNALAAGEYVVRVRASDLVGHRTVVDVPVTVAPGAVLDRFAVLPALVSPNGDGAFDTAAARIGLIQPASVSLDLLNASGNVVASVLSGASLPLGPTLASLDGTLAELRDDGDYVARVIATAGSVVEEQRAPIAIDRTRPQVVIASPGPGACVAGPLEIDGTVADAHMLRWSARLRTTGAPDVLLASGVESGSGALVVAAPPSEGSHEVVLAAQDLVGNSSETAVPIIVDRTAPSVVLGWPLDGSWISGRRSPVDVRLESHDQNLVSWSIVVEDPMGGSCQIASGTTAGPSSVTWDAGAEPDGERTLVARTRDCAGNAASATARVVVDNTLPIAVLEKPRDAYARAPIEVVGTADDANLEGWTLELGYGPPATAFAFVAIASGGAPVRSGTLGQLVSPPSDGIYTLRLTVRDRAGNERDDVASFMIDTTPPRPPVLQAHVRRPNDAVLAWTASPDPDVVGYRVLRGASGGALVPLGTALVGGLSLEDPGLADGTWRYAIVAVDAAGLESVASNEVSLLVDATPPAVAIATPRAGVAVAGAVDVVGTAYSVDDFKEYRVSVGEGAKPATFTLVRSSPVPQRNELLAVLDATRLPEGSTQTLRLEGEDLSGNVAQATVTFRVDNVAPAAPVLVSAEATQRDVTLTWAPGAEPDLAGYVVYRDGVPLNVPESALADPRAYLLPPTLTTFVDAGAPDGTFTYRIQAVDFAANPSALSNAKIVTIDLRAPSAWIANPLPLTRMPGTFDIVAQTADTDVATLQLEVRCGGPSFQAVGPAMTRPPWITRLDPALLPSPVIELRVVATDVGGRVDPAPGSVVVFFDRALAPPGLSAHVDGRDVALSWTDGNAAGRVAGYRVVADGSSVVAAPVQPRGTANASSIRSTYYAPRYAYDGNPYTSWYSASSAPQWWQVDLASPTVIERITVATGYYPSTFDVSVRVRGVWVNVARSVQASLYGSSTSLAVTPPLEIEGVRVEFTNSTYGTVDLADVTLTPLPITTNTTLVHAGTYEGTHAYDVTAVSPFGGTAAASATARVYRPSLGALPAAVPTTPIAVAGSGAAPGAEVSILAGSTAIARVVAANDGRFQSAVPLSPGQNAFTAQALDPAGNRSLPSWPVSTILDPPPAATIGLSLVGVAGSDVSLAFTPSGDTSSIAGFSLQRDSGDGFRAVERLGPLAREVVDAGVGNGTHSYRIVAFNARGFEGTPSNVVSAVVDVAVPAAPLLAVTAPSTGGALQLAWTFDGGQASTFTIERETAPGSFARLAAGVTTRTYVDAGLVNGTEYRYRVIARDGSGNAGPPSNVASGIPLDVSAPSPPRLVEPTVPGTPLTVAERAQVVAGITELDANVELSRNARFAGTAVAAFVGIEGSQLSIAHAPTTALDAPPGLGLVAYGFSGATGESRVAVEDLVSGSVFELSLPPGTWISEGPFVSPARDRVAVIGYGYTGGYHKNVYVGDVADGSMATVDLDPTSRASGVAWSPDGRRLAYVEEGSNPAVVVGDAAGTGNRACAGHMFDSPRWISEREVAGLEYGSDVALVACDVAAGAVRTIVHGDIRAWAPGRRGVVAIVVLEDYRYRWLDVLDESGARRRLGAATESSPVFSPDGRRVAWISDTAELMVANPGSAESRASGYRAYLGTLEWPFADMLLESSSWGYATPRKLAAHGRFEVPVNLDPGDNAFTAIALDAAGNRSAPSEPILVRLDTAQLPDLALSARVQPGIPIATGPANAIVIVRNAGPVASRPADVDARIAVAGGTRSAATVRIPALAPGGAVTAALPLDVSGLAGPYVLTAMVDAGEVLADADRSNNRADVRFSVSPDGAPQMTVSAQPPSVPCDGAVSVEVAIANPGPARDVVLQIVFADPGGATVLAAADRALVLPGSAVVQATTELPVGLTLAGDYKVVATAVERGSTVASGTARITIEGERAVSMALSSSRAQYAAADAIDLRATVTNGSRNAPLADSYIRFEIADAAGSLVVAQPARSLPVIWVGGNAVIETTSAAGTLAAGNYVARAVVELAGAVVAEARATFSIAAQPLLAGTVSVRGTTDPPSVKAGAPALATAVLRNVGTGVALAVRGRLVTVDGAGVEVGRSTFDLGDLAVSAAGSRQIPIPTAALPLGTYGVVLVAEYDARVETLATARFRVVDGRAPQLVLLAPGEGSFVRGTVSPSVRATDDASGVASVRAAVGGRIVPFSMRAGMALDGSWSGTIALLPEGPNEIAISAADAEGNDGLASPSAANPVLLHVVSDTIPPTVRIDGVVPNSLVNVAVTPVVVSEDVNLARVDLSLDGATFGGGPITADGQHGLVAVATDKAGNAGSASVRFEIDRTPPSITVAGVEEGAFVASDVAPRIVVSDRNLESYTALLDGLRFQDGTILTAERTYRLAVTARDRAANTADLLRTFTIDKTPPVIEITGVRDGAYVAGRVSPAANIADANLLWSETTLDGSPFVAGTVVSAEGRHVLGARAVDRAGNRTEASVSFVIDTTPPSISISGVAEGEITARDVVPLVMVTDANLAGWTTTVDGVDLPLGGAVTSEGPHVLDVVAKDLAGNVARSTVRFEIDRTPPEIWASVQEGAVYDDAISVEFGATDRNLAEVKGTLDGVAVRSGVTVDADGPHALSVEARDAAGNLATTTYRFELVTVRYAVQKRLLDRYPRVLALLPCASDRADRIEAFLRNALPGVPVAFVRSGVDLLVQLRSGVHDVVVIAGRPDPAGRSCAPTSVPPPLPAGTLDHRIEEELTEAAFRGVGLVVFREEQAAWPGLVEAAGLGFEGNKQAGKVTILASAVSGASTLAVPDGVELKLGSAIGFGSFERGGGPAAAIHGFGLGAAVSFGFDPSRALAKGDAASLIAGAIAFVTPETALAPRGVVAVGIDVTNERRTVDTRVRETLDPALDVVGVLDGGRLLPTGEIEWRFVLTSGATEQLAYLVRLPDAAGTYRTTTEVASMRSTGARVFGTYTLDIDLARGREQVAAEAERLALDLPAKGPDAGNRTEIMTRLSSVAANGGGTAEERERAITDLLAAIDAAKALRTVDPTPLRLAIDELLGVWEARP